MALIPLCEGRETWAERQQEERRQRIEQEIEREAARRAEAKLKEDLLAATRRLANGENKATDVNLILDHVIRWKSIILKDNNFESNALQNHLRYPTPNAVRIVDTLIGMRRLKSFVFPENTITQDSLQTLLNQVKKIMTFPSLKEEDKALSFLDKLLKFCTNIGQSLNDDQVNCLQRLIKDYKLQPSIHCSELDTLIQRIERTETLKSQSTIDTKRTSFGDCITYYLNQEYWPYIRIMHSEREQEIKSTKNSDPLLDFILNRHNGERCLPHPIYAPQGRINYKGVQKFLLNDESKYYSHREYAQHLQEIYKLRQSLLHGLNSSWHWSPWRAAYSKQMTILENLHNQLIKARLSGSSLDQAAVEIKRLHSTHLKSFFMDQATARLLNKIEDGGSSYTVGL